METCDETLLTRQGSVRGRKLHVFNTVRMMRIRSQWQRDYTREEMNKVVVYITTCGILRRVWERCRDTVELLKAHKIKAEFRDLNIHPSYVEELADRMRLDKEDRELVYDSLPMVYVNGKYFGVRSSFFECILICSEQIKANFALNEMELINPSTLKGI
ncbi:unnamed protein product [Haemonchus placei]|uniref:Glutaredoxin domain-containing protein n=1 Tax=Haemonchus placei TaxID=6290 RepID=A0A3P7XIQ3_HAEPC|nr:unnamed protein product [Haemonchus placei]